MGNNIKKWIIAIAIAIVFNLFTNYGLATFYNGPEYSDFCDENIRIARPLQEQFNNNDCEPIKASQELQDSCSEKKAYIDYKYDSNGCATEAFCETCVTEYDAVRKTYDGNVFVVLLIVAVAVLAAGIMLKVEAVSAGFLLAGILGLLIASTRYWNHLQDVYRFLLLGLALAILIWLGYKKVK